MATKIKKGAMNRGVGGNTSADGLKRLKKDVLTQPGSCVVVMFGANDAFIDNDKVYDYSTYWTVPKPSNISVSQYKLNLTSMIEQITGAGKEITLITPWAFWSSAQLNQFPFYVDAMKAVALQTKTPILDAYEIQLNLWWASQPWLDRATHAPSIKNLQQDYQHPSDQGHTQIANLCNKPQNSNACACRR
jgi:lysophospholipase L1-like esterase